MRFVSLLSLLALLLVACGDDDDASQSPTSADSVTLSEQTPVPSPAETISPTNETAAPSSTATPENDVAVCLIEPAFCDLAASIETALQAGDVDTVLTLIGPAVVECTAEPDSPPQGIDPAAELCEANPGAAEVPAYIIGARQSDAIGYIGAEELSAHLGEALSLALPDTEDEMGTGSLHLYTVADESSPECDACYVMVLSQVVESEPAGLRRTLFEFHIRTAADGGWQWGFLAEGPPLGNPQLLIGGDYSGVTYHYWSPEGVPMPPADGIYYGGGVVVTGTSGECLNLREQPSTSGAIVTCLPPDTLATVIEGPIEAEDFTWWEILHDSGEGPQRGWVAEDYIATFATDQQPPAGDTIAQ